MDLNFYLDKAKTVIDVTKDADLARKIGLTPQELNRARKQGFVTLEALKALSELSGIDLDKLLVAQQVSKAKDTATKAAWTRVLTRVGVAVVATSLSLQPVEFTADSSDKDYRKNRNPFPFKRLAIVLSSVLGTVSRLFPRQPMPIIR